MSGGRKKLTRKEITFGRFNKLWDDNSEDTLTLEYGNNHKYVIFSDLHIGVGKSDDNFEVNFEIFKKALKYYKNNGFSVILLGDIEEAHRNPIAQIISRYSDIYDLFRKFNGKVYRVFGNHDFDWAVKDPISGDKILSINEAIKLKKEGTDRVDIMMTHGHQAMSKIEENINLVRFVNVFALLFERTTKVKSESILDNKPGKKDKIYSDWAQEKGKILICGHTHCPIFSKRFIDYQWVFSKYHRLKQNFDELKKSNSHDKSEKDRIKKWLVWLNPKRHTYLSQKEIGKRLKKSPYEKFSELFFNTGGCLYRDAISSIEIYGDKIRSVFWLNKDEEMTEPVDLFDTVLNISDLLPQGATSSSNQ